MDFVAIDFETANQRADSACQVAAVLVSRSQIVDERVWLIRPPSPYFAPINISIHGIRPEDVESSPTMEEVWREMHQFVDGIPMVAHNARFDMGVLVASLSAYDVACPQFEFQCTRVLARAAWPGKSRYGLKPLGNWLGIEFQHHDALEDARCCAKVALAIESATGRTGSLEQLETQLRIQRGFYRNQRIYSPKKLRGRPASNSGQAFSSEADQPSTNLGKGHNRRYSGRQYADRWGFPVQTGNRPLGSLCEDTVRESCGDLPLSGKNIVLLGPLRGQSREQTHRLLSDLGATVQNSITSSTHYVIAPGWSLSAARDACLGTEVSEVERTFGKPQEMGPTSESKSGIRVLSERQFRAMFLSGGANEA